MTELVFVYGTLKRGHCNHIWLKSAKFLFSGEIVGNGWKMYSLGDFPAIMPSSDVCQPIIGEVYEVDEKTLKSLDLLEGYPYFYSRVKVFIRDNFGNVHRAWVYFMDCVLEEAKLIPSGVW